ncbi:bifunctional DNA primase/polymerase [Streptomyces sp. NPDC029554]|uniref:bifunctional DNA primase/polymerase n=1 Tax=Streptomyces sp. NPDC029554 TaxID=3155126 RepID=UPI0033E8BE94
MPGSAVTRSTAPTGPVDSLAVARWCARNGWPVHPLAPGQKTPAANCGACRHRCHGPAHCACIKAGRWCHGFHAATTSSERVDGWWSAHPGFGVGVACGAADLVVIDVDAHAAEVPDRTRLLPGIPIGHRVNLAGLATGFDTLALLAALRGKPSPAEDKETLRVRTPSGGLHIWYRNPRPEIRYRSSTGSSSRVALAWQVDVRSDNGYIVAPGTRTTTGTYTPIGTTRSVSDLPQWLATDLLRTGHVPTLGSAGAGPAGPPPRRARGSAPKAALRVLEPLLAEVGACAVVASGASFTEKLNRAAFTAGGLLPGGHLSEEEAWTSLLQVAHHARPHQQRRNKAIIASALSAGAQRPFHPRGRS